MFDFQDRVINKVFNPLKITKSSLLEFRAGELKDQGLFHFKKIIEFNMGGRLYARYLIYSRLEDEDRVFEVFPGNTGKLEAYVYSLADTIPFTEDFLFGVAGQRYMTTPDGVEYERCIMPQEEDRIDGLEGTARIYDISSDRIERQIGVKVWDYQRDANGLVQYLNIEMMEDSGMFRIFTGELMEDIFYKFYPTSKQE